MLLQTGGSVPSEAGTIARTARRPEDVRLALLFGQEPLLRQMVLLGPFVLSVLVVRVGDVAGLGAWYVVGLGVVTAATAAAVVLQLRPDPRLLWLVPALDFVGLGLMRLVPMNTSSGIALLVVLPSLWLGADYLRRGVYAVAALGLGAITVPTLLYYGSSAPDLSRAVLTPLVAVLCAATIAAGKRLWMEQARALVRRERELEDARHEAVQSQAVNDALVSAVDVGLVSLDQSGAYRSMNPRYADFMRLAFPDDHQTHAGRPGHVFAADRSTPLSQEELPTWRALHDETFSDEVIWVGEDPETRRALSVSARPIHDPAGHPDGAVLVYKDVTDMMSALKVRDDFVASVSHELRTPLTSIMGFLDLLLDSPDVDEGTRGQLRIVRRNAERLHRLVSDLLLVARTDQGRLQVTARRTDLSDLVRQGVTDLLPVADGAGVRVVCQIAPDVDVEVDPTRIRQMLDNLLSNAVKYTPAGGTVTVTLESADDHVVLRVADTGIGIAQQDLEHLFTRFFRTDRAETRAIQGAGLGLAITKSIVEAHDGEIVVQSRTEEGTDFEVTLPRQARRDAASEVADQASDDSAMPAVPTRSNPTRS